ncbi:ABC transporter ATP-binding protein [Demequina capsici]|uniref:ABC transporter ATP-binding protein n=1 Tax=Demequina capsici TaxID=3075620 RepID=A0AA96F5Q0_9MICO|nr:ABC transporter ATP-binding protein [Demequina sp. OYTSA14]WNM24187.1 ABC transporter ATP-binding protein [Demequina sp. OYTSA14]
MIEARGLTFGFPREVEVLRDVHLAVADEVVALTGPSGSGKSTLLLCLAGILVPSSGTVTVAGHSFEGLDLEGRSRVRREHLGLVFQFSELIAELTLAQNVALPLELLGASSREASRRAIALMEELGIAELSSRYPAQVSGGQAQRAAVARGLVHEPAVILADEPTGALDSTTGAVVLDLLLGAARRRGAAVVMATHDRALAASADRIVDLGSLSMPVHGASEASATR